MRYIPLYHNFAGYDVLLGEDSLMRLDVVASDEELLGHPVPVDVLHMAEAIAVPVENFVASLLPKAWQLTFPAYHLLFMGFEFFFVVKMGPADNAHNHGDSMSGELVLDGKPTSLVGLVTMRAEPHMRLSG